MSHATRAPRVSVSALRAVLASREGVAVWLPDLGEVEAAPSGLTKAQSLDPSLVVVLTHDEAVSYLASADGDHRAAAVAASATLAWQHRLGYLAADEAAEVSL